MDDSLILVNQINIRERIIKSNYHVVYFVFQFSPIFFFNLTFSNHLIDERISIIKQVVLSSSHLNSLSNFWEHIFDVFVDINFSCFNVLFTFSKNLVYKMLVFNDFGDLLVCLFVCVDEVDNDIVSKRKISEHKTLEEASDTRKMRKFR